MPLKDKITRRMRDHAITGTLAGVVAGVVMWRAATTASLAYSVIYGLSAIPATFTVIYSGLKYRQERTRKS
jgi:hypothetical protein